MRPAANDLEKDVIKDVPHAERDSGITKSAAPGAARKNSDGQEHDQRRGFANEFYRAEPSNQGQWVCLVRFDAVDHRAQVVNYGGFDPRHGHGVQGDRNPPSTSMYSELHDFAVLAAIQLSSRKQLAKYGNT